MVPIPKKSLRSGFSLPVVGLGTWGMGGWVEKDVRHDDEARTAIHRALDAGITHIDAAERYAEGHAEELVGEAIVGYDRSKLCITSKVSPEHLAYTDLLSAAERSLRRLKTDYLDLYLIHNPHPFIPIEETMRAMNRLVEEGLVRHVGVSNFSIRQMEDASKVSACPIVANQLHFNLSFRAPEEEGLLQHAQSHDWLFIAFRPIRDVILLETLPALLLELCEKYNKTAAQIAMNWLIQIENVVTITKSTSPSHLHEILGALDWSLSEEDCQRLKVHFPVPTTLPSPVRSTS